MAALFPPKRGQSTTLAGFLRHRRRTLGLGLPHVAQAAILPSAVVAGWEAGGSAAPSQLIHCAPVLQLPKPSFSPQPTAAGITDTGPCQPPPLPHAAGKTRNSGFNNRRVQKQ